MKTNIGELDGSLVGLCETVGLNDKGNIFLYRTKIGVGWELGLIVIFGLFVGFNRGPSADGFMDGWIVRLLGRIVGDAVRFNIGSDVGFFMGNELWILDGFVVGTDV